MAERMDLFKAYCMPSVMAQTALRFQWLVLLDIKTSEKWVKKIEQLAGPFLPLYVSSDWLHELQIFLRAGCNPRYLITTRLDSDDIIDPNYLSLVQEQFQRQQFTFIDAPAGYRLCDHKLYAHNERLNPFVSLIERDTCKTVLHLPHGRAMNNFAYKLVPGRRWIQVIHGGNYSNMVPHGEQVNVPLWARRYI